MTISSLGDAQNTWRKVEYPGGSRFDPIQPLSNGAIIRPWYGQRGLFRSMDNGQTWSLLIGPYSILYEPLTSGTRDVRYGSKDSIIVADGTDKDGQPQYPSAELKDVVSSNNEPNNQPPRTEHE